MAKAPPRLSNGLIGVAGVHFVAFNLSLRGLIVLPTIRNTAGIDLLVNEPRTGAQASLQVKASMQSVKFWPTSRYDKCLRGPRTFYVFLRYDSRAETFEAFLESGDQVAAQIEANARHYREHGRKEFSFWELPKSEDAVERLREEWRAWLPSASA